MPHLAGHTEARGEIAGAEENCVDARHAAEFLRALGGFA